MMSQVISANLARVGLRFGLPLCILAACLALLARELDSAKIALLPGHLGAVSASQWITGALLTMGSLWAVGRYDGLAHRALRTGISARQASLSGTIGIALGQTLGIGLLTGAMVRWRMLPELGAANALRLSTYVSFSFILAWTVVTSFACLFLPAPGWTKGPALIAMILFPLGVWVLFRKPVLEWRHWHLHLPSLTLAGAFVCWAAVDTLFAAAAFYVFLPDHVLPFTNFLPIFLIALGAGLLSNTPGGLGPFELTLLTAMPQVGAETVISTIMAYRLVYYALPAGLAALALLRPFGPSLTRSGPVAGNPSQAPRSEIGVVIQNGGHFAQQGGSVLALWPTGQTVTLFADPPAGTPEQSMAHLRDAAAETVKLPLIYKCSARLATAAREAGWSVLHLADDAIVDLPLYDRDIPARRTLRRKLRAAGRAQLRIVCHNPPPIEAMAELDCCWQQRNGPARGGSMGRLSADYIQNQWVACAYQGAALVAFVTAHKGSRDWCLDIMRSAPDTPDGTMHALVDAAICAARTAGARSFCLAATPACPDPYSPFWRWVARAVVTRSGGPGLRQFKSAFAPRWSARYAAAPNGPQLLLGLADLTQEILEPRPLPAPKSNKPHYLNEEYELDSRRPA